MAAKVDASVAKSGVEDEKSAATVVSGLTCKEVKSMMDEATVVAAEGTGPLDQFASCPRGAPAV